MTSLKGRTALITGVGRQNGIAAAIALMLASKGVHIFATYFQSFDARYYNTPVTEPETVLDSIRAHQVQVVGMSADLSLPTGPQHVFSTALNHFGHIDILINTAAYSVNSNILSLTTNEIDLHYAVNVRAMLLLCQLLARSHDGRIGGRIINFTSGHTISPMPNELPYIATKSAIEGLTLSLSRALAPQHITVNTIDPGATDTGWIDEVMREEFVKSAPFGRIGQPIDVAHLVHFLVSDQGQWITGQVIRSRGGT